MKGFVDVMVVTITADWGGCTVDVGDIFKNGLLVCVGCVSAASVVFKLFAARTLLSNFGDVISVLKILSDGTLILSIALRVSEKCVTVTVSVVPFVIEFGWEEQDILCFVSNANGKFGTVGDDTLLLFVVLLVFGILNGVSPPVKFNVNLSPP